jgi:uncharacterized hydrophobic protein (TIGR00271 family)
LVFANAADLARMRDQVLYDGSEARRKLSAFWVLLPLSAIIAATGVAADSTATVIGAMIVAPLMTPILGIVLSVITGDKANAVRSLGLVVAGGICVIMIAWGVGLLMQVDVVADTSSQVAGRTSPRLIDLIAALATGAVGTFALIRSDLSDTLPGVAIAISLVPPLAVVGLTLEAGESRQTLGALLLFFTNVMAIIVSGLVVMTIYRVRRVASAEGQDARVARRLAIVTVAILALALAVPLAVIGMRITSDTLDESAVADRAAAWASNSAWRIESVEAIHDGVLVVASGAPPAPSLEKLRRQLDGAGLDDVKIVIELIPAERTTLDPN